MKKLAKLVWGRPCGGWGRAVGEPRGDIRDRHHYGGNCPSQGRGRRFSTKSCHVLMATNCKFAHLSPIQKQNHTESPVCNLAFS